MNVYKFLKIAINASINGGNAIMEIYKTEFEVSYKKDESPLTLADRNCNEVIEKFLINTGIPILSEEGRDIAYSERKFWKYFWLVDPLDGTKEFVNRNGEFTVNLALIRDGSPIMGVVYVPVKGELYFAIEEMGSYKVTLNSNVEDVDVLIKKSFKLPIDYKREKFVIVGSRSHMSKETELFFEEKRRENKHIDIISVGSSLKLCLVAEGKADIYPRYAPTMEWDTAAGHAIVMYAGFSVKKYNSSEHLTYNKESLINPWFLVS